MSKAEQRVFFDRVAILGVADIEVEEVHIPQWKTWVRVRGLTAAERDAFEQSCLTGKGKNREVNMQNARAKLAVRSVVDADGNRVFQDSDYQAIGDKSASAVNRIWEAASRLSGIGEDDLEELAGNSAATPPDAFSTD